MLIENSVSLSIPFRFRGNCTPGVVAPGIRFASDSLDSRVDVGFFSSSSNNSPSLVLRMRCVANWARTELFISKIDVKRGQKLRINCLIFSPSLSPLHSIVLICRSSSAEEVSCIVGQQIVLPFDFCEMSFAAEWSGSDCCGDLFIAFQTEKVAHIHLQEIRFSELSNQQLPKLMLSRPSELGIETVVCVHNALEEVKKCLETLHVSSLRAGNAGIILVDDGSSRRTSEFLTNFVERAECPVSLVWDRLGSGYTKAVNRGILMSSAPKLLLLNSDTMVSPTLVTNVSHALGDGVFNLVGPMSNRATLQSFPEVINNGSWALNEIINEIDIQRWWEIWMEGQFGSLEVTLLNGFCLGISRSVFEAVGLFDDEFFPTGYGEETDFEMRALGAGFRSAILLDELVFHSGSQSFAAFDKNAYSNRAYGTVCAKHGKELLVAEYERTKRVVLESEVIQRMKSDILSKMT